MRPFTVYYKSCGNPKVLSMRVTKVLRDSVEEVDGSWNRKEDVYFTKKQAKQHKCDCILCSWMKG